MGVNVCPSVTAADADGAKAPNNPATPIANRTLRIAYLPVDLIPRPATLVPRFSPVKGRSRR
jgi:hypothetical protein